ncbi:disease resistance protein RLM3-like [Rutidosis leptorrhynchoides]|uniref:disease resistance protein RLM3-like n=1 Tax=Rutidosis leptorrhynchoides TaxID=125765 RepID=UPI003A99C52D
MEPSSSSSSCLVPYSSSKRKRDPSCSYDEHHRCKRPKCDVFLNYSFEDTANKFVSHLKAALKRNIFTMYDHNTLPIGQDMSCVQLKAIEESHTYLVVISTNYSRSVKSLDELVLIMDSLPNFKNRKVIPGSLLSTQGQHKSK